MTCQSLNDGFLQMINDMEDRHFWNVVHKIIRRDYGMSKSWKQVMCKKCGGEPKLVEDGFGSYTGVVACSKCGAETLHWGRIKHAKTQWINMNAEDKNESSQ